MLGALMFCSKIIMEALPNIHLLGMLTMVYTLAFRFKALIPIYIYVILNGIFSGFSLWWIPYLYIWTVLWGLVMLVPKRIPIKYLVPICLVLSCLHGLAYGALYAPAQALFYGMSMKATLAWIVSGFPFDVMHALGNLVAGVLIAPLALTLDKLESRFSGQRRIVK
jgi:energy-coupling factor transport system substrate-specific component